MRALVCTSYRGLFQLYGYAALNVDITYKFGLVSRCLLGDYIALNLYVACDYTQPHAHIFIGVLLTPFNRLIFSYAQFEFPCTVLMYIEECSVMAAVSTY